MAIDYSGTHSNTSQIHVTTEDGRIFFADKVIMTVPLVVMNNTQLFPELPATKRQAMENVYIPSGLKVWIEFDEDFYSDIQLTGSLFGYNNDAPFFFDSVFRKSSSRHCLTYFDVSPNTHKLTGLDDDEIISKLMEKLDNIFDGKATRHYLNHHVQNWEKQPHIGGAYSFGWDNYDWTLRELQRPINKKLYFAGEHTEPVEVATVHGAAISGRQAAQEVLKDLQ
jgi:monoamine oxidase